jgi:hypothetical protein
MLWRKVIASGSYRSGHKKAIIALFVIALVTPQPLSLLKVIALTARQKQ